MATTPRVMLAEYSIGFRCNATYSEIKGDAPMVAIIRIIYGTIVQLYLAWVLALTIALLAVFLSTTGMIPMAKAVDLAVVPFVTIWLVAMVAVAIKLIRMPK
jgi:hypothetical protein